MEQRKLHCEIKGVGSILFCKNIQLYKEAEKKKTETYDQHDERVWKMRAHYDSKGNVIIPSEIIIRSLFHSQKKTNNPIKPSDKKQNDMRYYFNVGLYIDNVYIKNGKKQEKMTKEDLLPNRAIVYIKGKDAKPIIRPMINNWSCEITGTVVSPFINEENLEEALSWVGAFCGWGSWSTRVGGQYGRFIVEKLKIE